MEKKRSLSLTIILIILPVLVISLVFLAYKKPVQENEGRECYADTDCIKTQTTCCPCNSGGQEICTNKENATKIQQNLKNCEQIFCAMVFNCEIENCACVNGKCASK